MTKEKLLENLRNEAKELWVDYLTCSNSKRATKILLVWKKKISVVHRLQTSINFLLFNKLQNDEDYLQQTIKTD
jgi:hypothetical protein